MVRALWKLMKTAWRKEQVPSMWQEATGVFTPKEQNSQTIRQFRSIALLNAEREIFLSILAKDDNNLPYGKWIHWHKLAKGWNPRPPRCTKHSTLIWDQIQRAKREKSELHVVWLHLTNAYGSVPHRLIDFDLEFFNVPGCVQNIIARYFSNLHMCVSLKDYTTGWQELNAGLPWDAPSPPFCFW